MRLSVLIPTLNEEANIAACVACAQGLAEGWGQDLEVLVAYGGSDDGTRERAADAGALVLDAARGRGRQLRAACEASTGAAVLMLHADCRLPAGAGAQLWAALNDTRVSVGAFRQRIQSERSVFRSIEGGNAWRARRLGLPYGDQGIFLRRTLIDEVGGVPDLPLMEDVALMQRVRRRAWPVLLDGPIEVSARRWRRHGLVRQTLRNWSLLAAFTAGIPAERLAPRYAPEPADEAAPGALG